MSEWQPIETAPKDGTEILVYAPNEWDDPDVVMAYYDDGYQATKWRIYLDGAGVTPTHWMPLPAPPTPTPER